MSLVFSSENIIFLSLVLTVFASLMAAPGILISVINSNVLDVTDLPIIGMFASLIYVSNFLLIVFPSVIFYVLPFAAGLTFYLPTGIIVGAFTRVSKKPGSLFLLMLVYGIISEFLSPNIFWFPYYIAWGGMLEAGRAILSYEEGGDGVIGFGYGVVGASLAVCYMMIGWGFYRPLFMTLPSAVMDGVLSSIGFKMGAKIGELTKKISI